MTESVEQAALRRARETRDDLPAPFGSIFGAVDAIATLGDARFRHVLALQDEIARCRSQLAEQGDAILALSNRIEAVTRNAQMPERPCPRSAVVHEPHVYRRGEDVFLCLGVKP